MGDDPEPPSILLRLPTDIWKLIWEQARGAPIRFVCTHWRDNYKYTKVQYYDVPTISLAKWILEKGFPPDLYICFYMARKGYFEVLKWMLTEQTLVNTAHWMESGLITGGAASGGHLEILRWAHSIGCKTEYHVYSGAIVCGNPKILEWAFAKEIPWDDSVYLILAEKGDLETFKWVRERVKNDPGLAQWDAQTCTAAARGNHFEVLKWLRANGCPWNEDVYTRAAYNENIEMLKWVHENRFADGTEIVWTNALCANIAWKGNLEMLKWARANGAPWCAYTCANAASNGHLEVLKWARVNGCPWNEYTCIYAVQNGHFESLKWAHENGCPWNADTCVRAAAFGRLEILKYLCQEGCPWTADIAGNAARNGQLEVLDWLFEIRLSNEAQSSDEEWEMQIIRSASEARKFHVLEWLIARDKSWIPKIHKHIPITAVRTLLWLAEKTGLPA